MSYKKKDKVLIKLDKESSSRWALYGEMDKWLGKIMTIDSVTIMPANREGTRSIVFYKMEEDEGEWTWYDNMIQCLATKENCCKCSDCYDCKNKEDCDENCKKSDFCNDECFYCIDFIFKKTPGKYNDIDDDDKEYTRMAFSKKEDEETNKDDKCKYKCDKCQNKNDKHCRKNQEALNEKDYENAPNTINISSTPKFDIKEKEKEKSNKIAKVEYTKKIVEYTKKIVYTNPSHTNPVYTTNCKYFIIPNGVKCKIGDVVIIDIDNKREFGHIKGTATIKGSFVKTDGEILAVADSMFYDYLERE